MPHFSISARVLCTLAAITQCQVTRSRLILNMTSDRIVSYKTATDESPDATYSETSPFLLGMCGYGGLSVLTTDSNVERLHIYDNVNVLGFGNTLSSVMPQGEDNRVECCNTTEGLLELMNSGDACDNFWNYNWDSKRWTDDNWWLTNYNNSAMIPFIYLKDSCHYYPQLSHCLGYDTAGGTPNLETPEEKLWWQLLFQAFVNCTFQRAESLGVKSQLADTKFHIWNEPNAHFWKNQKNGTYYKQFYYDIVSHLKSISTFSEMEIGGPVTWCPPTFGNAWEDYYLPLYQMNEENIIDNGDGSVGYLLDFYDFHGYTSRAMWYYMVNNLNLINTYNWIYSGFNILSYITETNQKITEFADFADDATHWKIRSLLNAQQVLAISHFPNKFGQRHLFDLNATSLGYYSFWGTVDEYMQHILGNLQSRLLINYDLYDTTDDMYNVNNTDAFFYSNVTEVISSVVFNEETNELFVYLVNNKDENIEIEIIDSSGNLQFNIDNSESSINGNMYALYTGIYYDVDISYIDQMTSQVTVNLAPLSIYQITGFLSNYNSDNSGDSSDGEMFEFKENQRIEYNCDNIDTVMIQITEDYEDVSVQCNINYFHEFSNLYNYAINKAYIRVGLHEVATTDYNWQITANINDIIFDRYYNTDQILWYNEIIIDSESFVNELSLSSSNININIDGSSVTTDSGNDIIGRLVTVSLVVEWDASVESMSPTADPTMEPQTMQTMQTTVDCDCGDDVNNVEEDGSSGSGSSSGTNGGKKDDCNELLVMTIGASTGLVGFIIGMVVTCIQFRYCSGATRQKKLSMQDANGNGNVQMVTNY